MKSFNQTITVQVEVDSIAKDFLASIKEDFKHRELLVESIIGSALEKGGLNYIYNSLHGYTGDIDFKVGDGVITSHREYRRIHVTEERKYSPIGWCKVVNINLYSDDKVQVEYTDINENGETFQVITWVSHLSCNKAPVE